MDASKILSAHFNEQKKYASLLNQGEDMFTAAAKSFGEKTAIEMSKIHIEVIALDAKSNELKN